jgi:hypothetical protein
MTEPLDNPPPARFRSRDLLLAAALLALSLGLIALWLRPTDDFTADRQRLEQLEARPGLDLAALERRSQARDERRDTEIGALRAGLDAVERRRPPDQDPGIVRRLEAVEAALARDLAAIGDRLAALEQGGSDDRRQASGRLDALERRPPTDVTSLRERLDRLEQRPASDPNLATSINDLTARLTRLETTAHRVTQLVDRLDRHARLRAIETALSSGQKLGEQPDLPDALRRFAHAGPATEAELQRAYPAVERAIRAAMTTRERLDGSAWERPLWERLRTVVTIRRGDGTLIGDDVDAVLERARAALTRLDLAGAERALSALPAPAQPAAASWIAEARAVLAARAALRDLLRAEP